MDRARARALAQDAIARGKALSWFEALYREADGGTQHREVEVYLLDDAGAPHLEDDIVAAGEQSAVRLSD